MKTTDNNKSNSNKSNSNKSIENKSLKNAKRKFILSLVFLVAGLIYLISPIDLIPDILIPFGWIDDIAALFAAFVFSGYSYLGLKKATVNK